MESLYLLIPIALVFVALAIRLLLWAINSGQYDNLDTEAHRILFDEDASAKTDTSSTVTPPPAISSAVTPSADSTSLPASVKPKHANQSETIHD